MARKVCCDACKEECTLQVSGPTDLKDALPAGWRPRRLDGEVYILCDICGSIRQFEGGLSAYLQELLGLPFNVSVETPEFTDFPQFRSQDSQEQA